MQLRLFILAVMIGLLLGFIVNNLEMGAKFNPDRPEQGQLFSEFIS